MWEFDEKTMTKHDTELKEPPMYKVLLLNDDYTPMDFVVMILVSVFNKSEPEAHKIMMNVHRNGHGVCGVYTYEVAETKTRMVEALAEANEYPLRSTMEQE